MFGCLELFFFFQLHNNWRNAFLITEVEWTNHRTRNAIFRVEYLKIFSYLIKLRYLLIIKWCDFYQVSNVNPTWLQSSLTYVISLFPFLPVLEKQSQIFSMTIWSLWSLFFQKMYVKSWIDIRLKLPVSSLIVSINFPVGNRVNPPQSYTNMKIFLDPRSDYCFTYSACSHPTSLLIVPAHILLLPIILWGLHVRI